MALSSNYLVLYTSKYTKLSLNSYVVSVCILNNLLCKSDVLLVRKCRTIDHYRREAHIYTILAELEAISMIKVENDFRSLATQFLSILNSTLCHVAEKDWVGIVAGTLGNLKDHR